MNIMNMCLHQPIKDVDEGWRAVPVFLVWQSCSRPIGPVSPSGSGDLRQDPWPCEGGDSGGSVGLARLCRGCTGPPNAKGCRLSWLR